MLHKLHRISALLIGVFVLFHLINHMFILGGVAQHINFMNSFRVIYRNILMESVLLTCVIFQVSSGIYFVWKRRGQREDFIDKAQAISGLYLAFFFLNHVGTVLFGRLFTDLDTNIYYGIAGFHVTPFQLYFVPYYFFAVVAIFIHIAAAFNWLTRKKITEILRKRLAYSIVAIGAIISMLLMLGFSGTFNEVIIPSEYRATYQ